MNCLDSITYMHKHFGISRSDVHLFSVDEKIFRTSCMREELSEYRAAKTEHDGLDALIDLLIFTYGTVERQGLSQLCDRFDSQYISRVLFKTIQTLDKQELRKFFDGRSELGYLVDLIALNESILDIPMSRGLEIHLLSNIEVAITRHFMSSSDNDMANYLMDVIVNALTLIVKLGYRHQFALAFHVVMEANLKKQIGSNPKRDLFRLDLIKPEGWTAPDLTKFTQFKESSYYVNNRHFAGPR